MDVGLPPCLSPRTSGRMRVDIPFRPWRFMAEWCFLGVFLSTLFIHFFSLFFPPERVSVKMWNNVLSSFLESCGTSLTAGKREI